MRTLFITLSAVVILTGCSEKKPISFENDTEPHDWTQGFTIKERSNAHSGKFVSVIDSTNSFSLAFHKKIQDISEEKIKSVTFSYWIFVSDLNAKGKTVLGVDDEGKLIDWQGRIFQDRVSEPNKWVQISETFTIPDKVEPKDILSLCVWNESKSEILVDDFQVTFN